MSAPRVQTSARPRAHAVLRSASSCNTSVPACRASSATSVSPVTTSTPAKRREPARADSVWANSARAKASRRGPSASASLCLDELSALTGTTAQIFMADSQTKTLPDPVEALAHLTESFLWRYPRGFRGQSGCQPGPLDHLGTKDRVRLAP